MSTPRPVSDAAGRMQAGKGTSSATMLGLLLADNVGRHNKVVSRLASEARQLSDLFQFL